MTSFGYAYWRVDDREIIAFSIGLVSSVPLLGSTSLRLRAHVTSWPHRGSRSFSWSRHRRARDRRAELVESLLGAAYGEDVGDEVAALIVVFRRGFSPATAWNVTFPLAFVADQLKRFRGSALGRSCFKFCLPG